MRVVFADSFYFLALLIDRDAAHARASQFAREFQGRLFTTEWVLTELADGLAASAHRRILAAFRSDLKTSKSVTVVKYSSALLTAGVELYDQRPDKQWSLTDCVSFVVMQREGITEALTGDRHYE
jgi:predicted nucleic acid-binding protein